jgi:hypothetical protein
MVAVPPCPRDLLPDPPSLPLLISPILSFLLPQHILPPQRVRTVIDPTNHQAAPPPIDIRLLFYPTDPLPAQVLGEFRQTRPPRRVHVHMLLIADVLLVKVVDVDLLLAVARTQQLDEIPQELVGVVVDGLAGVFAGQHHVPEVGLGGDVAFETVSVAHLKGVGLTVPAEALQAFAFHLVGDVFCGAYFGAKHGGGFERGRMGNKESCTDPGDEGSVV